MVRPITNGGSAAAAADVGVTGRVNSSAKPTSRIGTMHLKHWVPLCRMLRLVLKQMRSVSPSPWDTLGEDDVALEVIDLVSRMTPREHYILRLTAQKLVQLAA
jgi:hypothetical protein